MAFRKVAVLGLGKVGHLAAELLAASGFSVLGVDAREKKKDTPVPVRVADLADCKEITDILGGQEAVLSCLPYHLNKNVASAAHALGIHYFDLTEDVATTRHVRQLAQTAKGIMAPQCGLAPGFIAIVGAHRQNSSTRSDQSASALERYRRIEPAYWAMPSIGRTKASSINISTTAR